MRQNVTSLLIPVPTFVREHRISTETLRRWEADPDIPMPPRVDVDGRTTGYRAADLARWKLRLAIDARLSGRRSLKHPLPLDARAGEFHAARRLKAKARGMAMEDREVLWEMTRADMVRAVQLDLTYGEWPGNLVKEALDELRALPMPAAWDPHWNPMTEAAKPRGSQAASAAAQLRRKMNAKALASVAIQMLSDFRSQGYFDGLSDADFALIEKTWVEKSAEGVSNKELIALLGQFVRQKTGMAQGAA